MVRAFELSVSVPRRGDQQEQDVPLLNIHAPASPPSPNNPTHSPTSSPRLSSSSSSSSSSFPHSLIMPVKDSLSDAFSLPSRFSFLPSPSHPPHPHHRSLLLLPRLLSLLLHLSLLTFSLLAFHSLSMSYQQSHLRCQLLSASHLLSLSSLSSSHWWDFGTLLGLVREGDIIYTEVDADLSLTWRGRNLLLQHWQLPHVRTQWQQLGFVRMEERDELKLRVFDDAGWFLDVDIWDTMNASSGGGGWPTQVSAVDAVEPAEGMSMQMLTGRLDAQLYNLPSASVLPIAQQPAPAAWSHVCRRQLRVMEEQGRTAGTLPSLSWPARPADVLQHWYGPGWVHPRRYDKGVDATTDRFEQFMWAHLEQVYELLWAFKVAARSLVNALAYHPMMVGWYGGMVGGFVGLGWRWGRRLQRRAGGGGGGGEGGGGDGGVEAGWWGIGDVAVSAAVRCGVRGGAVLLAVLDGGEPARRPRRRHVERDAAGALAASRCTVPADEENRDAGVSIDERTS